MGRVSKEVKSKSAPITIKDEQGAILAEYPPELVDTIKATVAKDATDEELYMFLSIANQYNLNPFMKEIWFTKMNGDVAIMTSRDGYRKLAMREPTYKKTQSMAVYENDEFEVEMIMGEVMNITHKFKQNDRGRIIGAYAVLKTITGDNYVSYVDFREYDKRNSIWKKYPTSMIRKVAENDVYQRFVDINGLNDYESMPNKFYKDLKEDEFNQEFEPIDIQEIIDDVEEEPQDDLEQEE